MRCHAALLPVAVLFAACSTDRQPGATDDLAMPAGVPDASSRIDLAQRIDQSAPADLDQTPSCGNHLQDDDETDVDCGGPLCPKCKAGQRCALDRDCDTGHCNNTICGGPPVRFSPPVDTKVGMGPVFLASSDFDGDGKPDLAVADNTGNDVAILLNQGNGTFRAAAPLVTGSGPSMIATGDLDGDGRVDLAVADAADVAIFLGNGDGTFKPAGRPASCQGLRWLAIADLTGDGKPDVVEACVGFPPFNSLKTLTVLVGDGTGALPTSRTLPCDDGPDVVLAADVNGDHKTDLVVASGLNRITTLVGDGNGGFTPVASAPLGSYAVSIALGDINRDGKPDLITAELVVNNSVEVFLGSGDGTWKRASQQTSGVGPRSITLADFNRDGALDFAAASNGLLMNPDNAVRVFLGDGKGQFGYFNTLSAGMIPDAVLAADFNGDGKSDLAVANGGDNTVSVLLNAN